MRKIIFLWIILISFNASANPCKIRDKSFNIVTTLPAINSIILHLIDGAKNVNSDVLIQGNITPHDYLLKPSAMKKINEANMVVIISTGLETFMKTPFANPSQCQTWVVLEDNQKLLPFRNAGVWNDNHYVHDHDEHDHDEHDHDEHMHDEHMHDEHAHDEYSHNEHSHDGYDYHIWLSPMKMISAAKQIKDSLIKHNHENSDIYNDNYKKLETRLLNLHKQVNQKLSNKDITYLVFHDAFQYFEIDYGMVANGSFTGALNLTSAKKYNEIIDFIKENDISCVIYEPQSNFKVNKDLKIKALEIDLTGSKITKDKNFYFNYINSIANTFSECSH